MWALTAGVRSAVGGAASRTSVAASPSVATAQVITRQATTNAMLVGCTAMQGELCSHTLERCPNCKGNHIALSSRCARLTEAAKAAKQSRIMDLAGQPPSGEAMHIATGTNREVLGPSPRGVEADGGSGEEEMAAVEEEEAMGEARDITMTETEAEIATTTANETQTETVAGALGTDDKSDPAQLRKVI
jgi:hypothetical protein